MAKRETLPPEIAFNLAKIQDMIRSGATTGKIIDEIQETSDRERLAQAINFLREKEKEAKDDGIALKD